MDYFNSLLPLEISSDILARLPTESVLDSKLVCTRWRYIVSNHPSFSNMHFHHSSSTAAAAAALDSSCKLGFLALTYDNDDDIHPKFHYFEYNKEKLTTPIQRIRRVNLVSPFMTPILVGSYNGLVCLVKNHHSNICICNPITKEFVVLPEINGVWIKNYHSWNCTTGFGYVSSTNEYKVFVIFVKRSKAEEVYIYTLGSGSGWRNLGNSGFEFDTGNWYEPGIFANGALYWMMDYKFKMILKFDLAEEKFHEHLLPPPLPADNIWLRNKIGVLNGILFFAITLHGEGDEELDEIWLLKRKDEQNNCWSFVWTKEFRVPRCEYIAITNKHGVLTNDFYSLSIYDTKTSTSKSLVKFRDWFFKVNPHWNTFISLKELGEEDTKVMASIEIEETKSCADLQDEDEDPEYVYL